MNINFTPQINQRNGYHPNFTAIPLATYNYLHDKDQNVIVYQLENEDIPYLQNISDNIDRFYKKHEIEDESTKEVLKKSIDAGIEILSNEEYKDKKTKVLLALSDEEPSAILVGNAPKVDKNGKIHYSSRKNHAKDETELDALATWNKKILGEGKVILTEYFHTVLKDGFKQIYVRSEIPENSFAKDFYIKMGFKELSDEQRKIQRKNDYNYMSDIFNYGNDPIIPMKVTTKDIQKSIKKRFKELERKEFKDKFSVDLPQKEL